MGVRWVAAKPESSDHGPHGNQAVRRSLVSSGGIPWRLRRRESGHQPIRCSRGHGRRWRICRNGWGTGRSRRRSRRKRRPVGHGHQRRAWRLCPRRQRRLCVRYRPDWRPDVHLGGDVRAVRVCGLRRVARCQRAGRVRSRRQRRLRVRYRPAGRTNVHLGGHVRGLRVRGARRGRRGYSRRRS